MRRSISLRTLLVWGAGQSDRDLRKISVPRIGGFGRVDASRDGTEIFQGFLPDVLGKSDHCHGNEISGRFFPRDLHAIDFTRIWE
jgi:hypothetical protein